MKNEIKKKVRTKEQGKQNIRRKNDKEKRNEKIKEKRKTKRKSKKRMRNWRSTMTEKKVKRQRRQKSSFSGDTKWLLDGVHFNVVVNIPGCNTVGSGFELQSREYIHFRTNYF